MRLKAEMKTQVAVTEVTKILQTRSVFSPKYGNISRVALKTIDFANCEITKLTDLPANEYVHSKLSV